MRDRVTGEAVILELPHSTKAYSTRYRFPFGYVWAHPAVAWAALREVMPWEALVLSVVVWVLAWTRLGHDLGTAIGVSVTLPLVAIQMMRTRTFVTTARLVRQRGLLPLSRSETLLSAVRDGSVEHTIPGAEDFGDVVLVTTAGEERLRAVSDPAVVLGQILALRNSGKAALVGAASGRTRG